MPIPDDILNLLHGGASQDDLTQLHGVAPEVVGGWFEQLSGWDIPIGAPAKDWHSAPLSPADIRAQMNKAANLWLRDIVVKTSISSTNRLALCSAPQHPSLFLAEVQFAGRGQRGRNWVSPWGNLTMTLAWRAPIAQYDGLSLLVGAAVAEALEHCGLPDVQLKWPNDLLYRGGKIGGILVETSAPDLWVVGIGVNLVLSADQARDIDQQWRVFPSHSPELRNRLCGAIANRLYPLCGCEPGVAEALREAWRHRDALCNRQVVLQHNGRVQSRGIARGIDDAGALLLEGDSGITPIHSGELSLRVDEHA